MYTELLPRIPEAPEVDRTVKDLFERKGYGAAKEFVMLNSQMDGKADALVAAVEKEGLQDKEKLEILLEGLIPKTDQIANVIDRIRRKSADLDKEAILWDVRYHSKLESGRPCLLKLSFSVRKDKVDVHVFFRSHDICQGWFFNYYAIVELLGRVARESGTRPGFVVMESQSAHIYQKDWQTVEKLIKERIDDAPINEYFDPEKDLDPRGIVNIVVRRRDDKAEAAEPGDWRHTDGAGGEDRPPAALQDEALRHHIPDRPRGLHRRRAREG